MNRFEMIQQQKAKVAKPRVLFVLYNNMGSITNRIRGLIFAEPLRELGWTAEFIDVEDATEDQLVSMAVNFDIVYLLKIPFISFIRKLRRHTSAKLVFDLTDALWMPHHRWNKWHDLEAILSEVDAIYSDNEFVADYGRKYNKNVHVIPACTQVERFDEIRTILPARSDDGIVIGWVGTASTINALHVIKEPLEHLFARHSNLHLRLLILGFSDMSALPDFQHVRFSILPKYDEEDMIREVLQMDIGVFPPPCGLEDYAIRGPLKGLIYMTGGIPAVCENGGGCAAIIQDGVNGMLASSPEEWEQKLEQLIASRNARAQMGQNALATVRKTNSLKAITERLVNAFLKVLYDSSGPTMSAAPHAAPGQLMNKTSKRIMIACSHFWPSIGGVENRIEQFSASLVAAGYDVTIVTPSFPGRTSNVRNGVMIQSIDPAADIEGVPAWPFAVRYALMSGDYDTCILIQDPLGNIIWSVEGAVPPPATRLIIQPIINADGYGKWRDHDFFGPRLAGILKGASTAVAMTKTGPENQFMHLFGIKPVYIPNASSVPEPAGDFRVSYNIPADRFVILHVANLYWVKNHIGLLESLRDLPESWLLVMVGNPSGEPDCAQKVMESLAGRPDVLYIPGLSREWVSAAMKASDVIVLSSFGEGSPNTILEAMAQGRPWLATPQCGAANDHAGGIICNLADFKAHLAILKNNQELRQLLGDLGKRHWQSCLSWPKVVAGWIDLIETGSLHDTFEMPADIKETMDRIKQLVSDAVKHAGQFVLPESRHAHHWLDGLRGLEIGPSAQNPFGLDTRYVGMRDEIYEEEQLRLTGSAVSLDIEALADNIPLPDESEDFILSSHVIEHCPDVITTLLEWFRIVRKEGLIYMIVPLRNAARSDVGREIHSWSHILGDFDNQTNEFSEPEAGRFGHCHYHVFDIDSMREIVSNVFGERLQLVDYLEQDDKIGNGFTLVYRKVVACRDAIPWEFWRRFMARRTQVQSGSQENVTSVNIGMITYNRLEFTRQVIDALVNVPAGCGYSLTVVDNASTDGTREYLQEQAHIGIIKNLVLLDENAGVAKASNLAWSLEPEARYYLKLDNDIVIRKPGWLGKMVDVVEALPEAGAVAYNFEPTSYPLSDVRGTKVRIKSVGNLGGACILIPRRTHVLLGFWCEDYGLYGEEDADLGFRIHFAGLLNVYMEDEEAGFHLPAGRAAKINDLFVASDGIEESMHSSYRAWKDETRRSNILSGALERNVEKYAGSGAATFLRSSFAEQWRQQQNAQAGRLLDPAQPAPLKIGVFSLDKQEYACPQIRLISPFASFGESVRLLWGATSNGTVCTTNLDVVEAADLIVIQRFYPRPGSMPYVERLFASGKPVIYEVDDLITGLPDDNHLKPWVEETSRLLPEVLARCNAVTVSTPLLAEAFKQYNPAVYILPNLIDETIWQTSASTSPNGPVVIGFAGTPTHRADLMAIEPALFKIAQKYGNRVAFRFMGDAYQKLATLPGYSFIPFAEDYRSYARTLGEAGFDIALVPLQDNPFNRCKSNIKWLEYSLCGVAGIYSDLIPYNSCIKQGATGVLVDNDPEKWFQAISLLIEHPEARKEMARNARAVVVNYYAIRTKAQLYLDTYRKIMAAHQLRHGSTKDSSQPEFSIIILSWNRARMLEKCLASLYAALGDCSKCEIIVGDNGSNDDTASVVAAFPVDRYLRYESNAGVERYRELFQAARGKYLICLDDDVLELPKSFEKIFKDYFAAFPDYGLLGLDVVQDDKTNGAKPEQKYYRDDVRYGRTVEEGYVIGCCMCISRDVFKAVGGFDGTRLTLGEADDAVLYRKVTAAGQRAGIIKNIKCFHATGPAYSQQFNCLERDIEKYRLNELPAMMSNYIAARSTATDDVTLSIIIPVFNQLALTRQCLEALSATLPVAIRSEVIVVDNASSDGTAEYLQNMGNRITVISNRENLGFAAACNQGGRAARGGLLLFLNNDTVPKAGWLEALVAPVDSGAADICGARLLYPDGRCQHAGIAFDERGLGYHIFSNFSGEAAPVMERRYMQAVTGACLLLRKALFLELGGFDEAYRNGFEDVDFCLRAGEAGKRILYVPQSVVTHYAEQSAGRKDHDIPNMQRFFGRWQGKIRHDDSELYARFGLACKKEPDGRIVVTADTAQPLVSIIIPLYNQVDLTRSCLESLERNTTGVRHELVLVDNGSADGTAGFLAAWENRAAIIRNHQNRGFAVACNQGARSAKGKYLLFLNNDTEVMAGWLEPLLNIMEQDGSVTAVGSKLLYPDGTIQHAGVALIDDRQAGDRLQAKNQYVGFPADHPAANILKRVQALTAACLMVRREAFEAAGGFDEGYWNGYEDVDLCLKLAQRGGILVYQPDSTVVHHESRSGAERFQRAGENIRRLHDLWLGKARVDAVIQPDGSVQIGPAVAEGLVGAYMAPQTQALPASTAPGRPAAGARYPLIPLVASSATSVLQKITSSQRLRNVLKRYSTDD